MLYRDPFGLYGTKDCSYYKKQCDETKDPYYCHLAPIACSIIEIPFTNWDECIRQCLQDYDRKQKEKDCSDKYTFDDFIDSHSFCAQECLKNSNKSPFN